MDERTQQLCIELGALPGETSRTDFLDRHPQLVQISIVADLAEAVRRLVRVNVPEAMKLAEAAVAVAMRLGDEESIALGLRAKANSFWFMGDCKAAVDLYSEAIERFEKTGNMSEVGRTLSTSIQSLLLLGEYQSAFTAAERAREIFSSLGDTLRLARLEINVANIYHRQNHFTQALLAYRRAYDHLLQHEDAEASGVVLHNIAVCLIALDDFPGALDAFRQMRDFCGRRGMPLLESQADYNIAYLFYLRGDYSQALDLLRASRETCRKNNDKYHLGLCDLDQSEIYLELGLTAEAAEMAQKSFEQFKELGMNFETAKSIANLAIAEGLQGMVSHSRALFEQAKEIIAGEKNKVWPSLLDLYQALLLFNEGDFAGARVLCEQALTFFASASMPSKHVLCLLLLARICLKEGLASEAKRHSNDALAELSKLDAPMLSYQAHFVAGCVHEALQQPHDAYHSYQASRSALNALRGGLQTEELRISFMKNKIEVYARLVQLCLQRDSSQQSQEEAFSYVEEAKSRTLRDLIFGREHFPVAAGFENNPAAQRIRELRKELNWRYRRVEREQLSQEGASREFVESMQVRIRANEQELLRLERESPPSESVRKSFRNSAVASLDEIRASLGSEACLVEYFLIEDRVYAAVLTVGGLEFLEVASISRISHALRLFQFQMSKFRLGPEYVAQFHDTLVRTTQNHLQAIYQELLAPFRHLLTTPHLVIVPYGPLHSLPFHALFDGRQYLIDAFTISYAPSASIYALCRRQTGTFSGTPLIFGVEDPKIPFVKQEVEEIAAVVPQARVFWGAHASERALRANGGGSAFIHIATHGHFRQDSPMFSAIRLADSHLSLYDLYHMDLRVDLLTLSGCVTGMNVIAEGDEPIGLTRGLLYAGARSLLLSLWDADDQSTAELMKLFYSHLQAQNKAEALRSAMLNVRTRYPHPYYWAAFRLTGRF